MLKMIKDNIYSIALFIMALTCAIFLMFGLNGLNREDKDKKEKIAKFMIDNGFEKKQAFNEYGEIINIWIKKDEK